MLCNVICWLNIAVLAVQKCLAKGLGLVHPLSSAPLPIPSLGFICPLPSYSIFLQPSHPSPSSSSFSILIHHPPYPLHLFHSTPSSSNLLILLHPPPPSLSTILHTLSISSILLHLPPTLPILLHPPHPPPLSVSTILHTLSISSILIHPFLSSSNRVFLLSHRHSLPPTSILLFLLRVLYLRRLINLPTVILRFLPFLPLSAWTVFYKSALLAIFYI